ncbi:hypothetical protein DYB36_012877 [Aphanomyces astaci]|uniref:Uncharacterized protein n=1 Tax=Aphanomyces astaci TaxID=112090 RepID=A0A397BPI6_APHAT|nr:hypothetical protein DYB36_012877 [Aphanomyces astaci]
MSTTGFYVNNATWPSGSYVAEGTPPIVTYLVKTIVTTVGGSFGIAIAISSIYRRIIHKQWLVSTVWCRSNSVLSALHLPNCITALPLEKWGKDKRHANQLPNQLISIYALVPAMVVPSWVSSLGIVDHNQFTPPPATRLAQGKPVVHTRGFTILGNYGCEESPVSEIAIKAVTDEDRQILRSTAAKSGIPKTNILLHIKESTGLKVR